MSGLDKLPRFVLSIQAHFGGLLFFKGGEWLAHADVQ